jgi:hypothetical protein
MTIKMTNNKVKNIPNSIYYFPNFITPEYEQKLLEHVNSAPLVKWTNLKNRRLQNWGKLALLFKLTCCIDYLCRRYSKLKRYDIRTPALLVN